MKASVFDQTGKQMTEIELPEAYFGQKVNPVLMAQAVRVYLSRQRQGGAKVKTRADIERTKAKWYRQKGTGRARHGARSAPIFVGGGVAHGPKQERNYSLDLSKGMKKQALVSALSAKAKDKEVAVIENLSKLSGKTKEMVRLVREVAGKGKVLLVMPERMEKVLRAARNLQDVEVASVRELNTYQVLNGGLLMWGREAIEKLEEKKVKEMKEKQVRRRRVKKEEKAR